MFKFCPANSTDIGHNIWFDAQAFCAFRQLYVLTWKPWQGAKVLVQGKKYF